MLELLQEMSWYIEEQDQCLKLNDLNSFGGRRLYQDVQTKVHKEILNELTKETETANTSKSRITPPLQCPNKLPTPTGPGSAVLPSNTAPTPTVLDANASKSRITPPLQCPNKLPKGPGSVLPSNKAPTVLGATLVPVQLQFIEILGANDPRHPDNKKQPAPNIKNLPPAKPKHKSSVAANSHSPFKIMPHHFRRDRSRGPFKCNICGEIFNESNALAAHQLRHTSNRPLKCDNCPARFFTEYELGQHGKIHRRNERYRCSYCNASFSVKRFLLKHEILHSTSYLHPQTINNTHQAEKTNNIKPSSLAKH